MRLRIRRYWDSGLAGNAGNYLYAPLRNSRIKPADDAVSQKMVALVRESVNVNSRECFLGWINWILEVLATPSLFGGVFLAN